MDLNVNELLKDRKILINGFLAIGGLLLLCSPGVITLFVIEKELLVSLEAIKLFFLCFSISLFLYLLGFLMYASHYHTILEAYDHGPIYTKYTTILGTIIWGHLCLVTVGVVAEYNLIKPLLDLEKYKELAYMKHLISYGIHFSIFALMLGFNLQRASKYIAKRRAEEKSLTSH